MPGRELLWLETGSGRIEAWFLPGRRVSRGVRSPLLIFFHGNGEVIDFLPGQVSALLNQGIHVLLVEYPGYGRSTGSPSETAITEAAVASYDTVAGRPDVDPARIVAFGRSLGGGAACALTLKRPLAALILQSSFTSTRPFARKMLLPGFLARDVFDNLAAVRRFTGPILVVHGRKDNIIPFWHGEELARAARNGRFIEFNCAHNDCPPDMEAFWNDIGEWMRVQKIR